MSTIDRTSLAFIGCVAMYKCHNISEESALIVLEASDVLPKWEKVAKVIADEAIRRYKLAEWPTEKPAPKVDILKITRDLSR